MAQFGSGKNTSENLFEKKLVGKDWNY